MQPGSRGGRCRRGLPGSGHSGTYGNRARCEVRGRDDRTCEVQDEQAVRTRYHKGKSRMQPGEYINPGQSPVPTGSAQAGIRRFKGVGRTAPRAQSGAWRTPQGASRRIGYSLTRWTENSTGRSAPAGETHRRKSPGSDSLHGDDGEKPHPECKPGRHLVRARTPLRTSGKAVKKRLPPSCGLRHPDV